VRGGAGEKWIKGEMRTRQHRQRGAVRREYAPPMRGPEGRVRRRWQRRPSGGGDRQ
jgi:hypothetical protein